jgi:hypothetical protein
MNARRPETASDHHAGPARAACDGYFAFFYAWRFS